MRFPRLTYSRVVSTLALFIALGGTGYAAVSINGRNIADHSIAARKLVRGAVVPRAASVYALPGVTIRSARSRNFARTGQAAFARVLCHKGEQVLGGGGSYDEADVPATTEGQPVTSRTGKEDVRDRLIGSRPVVEGTRHTSRLQPAQRQYIGWPDSFLRRQRHRARRLERAEREWRRRCQPPRVRPLRARAWDRADTQRAVLGGCRSVSPCS